MTVGILLADVRHFLNKYESHTPSLAYVTIHTIILYAPKNSFLPHKLSSFSYSIDYQHITDSS